jgi:hypothetical protein
VITAACETLIASVLVPRFFAPYPVSIEPEFEAPFARLEYAGRDRGGIGAHCGADAPALRRGEGH